MTRFELLQARLEKRREQARLRRKRWLANPINRIKDRQASAARYARRKAARDALARLGIPPLKEE